MWWPAVTALEQVTFLRDGLVCTLTASFLLPMTHPAKPQSAVDISCSLFNVISPPNLNNSTVKLFEPDAFLWQAFIKAHLISSFNGGGYLSLERKFSHFLVSHCTVPHSFFYLWHTVSFLSLTPNVAEMILLLTVLYDSRHAATFLCSQWPILWTSWCSRHSLPENKALCVSNVVKCPLVDHLVSDRSHMLIFSLVLW